MFIFDTHSWQRAHRRGGAARAERRRVLLAERQRPDREPGANRDAVPTRGLGPQHPDRRAAVHV